MDVCPLFLVLVLGVVLVVFVEEDPWDPWDLDTKTTGLVYLYWQASNSN